MQVVLPIAGKGKRMAKRYAGPKQLLPVAGRPLIEYTLDRLPPVVDELVLVVGGPYEQRIREYFGRDHRGRKVTFVRQSEPLGLGHAIQQAQPVVRGRFLVVTPDDIYAPQDLARMVEGSNFAVLAKRVERPEQFGVFVRDEAGYLLQAVEKPKEFISDLASTGAYVLDPEMFDMRVSPSHRGEIELPDIVVALVRERQRRIRVLEASFWLPVNDPDQLTAAEQEMLRQGVSAPQEAVASPRR